MKVVYRFGGRTFAIQVFEVSPTEFKADLRFIGGRKFDFTESTAAQALMTARTFAEQNNSIEDEHAAVFSEQGFLPGPGVPSVYPGHGRRDHFKK